MTDFIKNGNNLTVIPNGITYTLEAGKVYDLDIYKSFGEVVTKFTINGELNMPPTIYQTKKDKMLVDRVLNRFNNTEHNTTGVLLTGDKGTGKSVTAKIIASKANLPIVIINPHSNSILLENFFKSIDVPICILFDEVDKNFNTEELLTFLDGLHKTSKKLVIMTANNEKQLSEYIKNRCSRIHYYRHYNMHTDAEEYANLICEEKKLENKNDIVKFIINNIKHPSIDNISAFIDEYIITKDLNITPEEVIEFMNINVDERTEKKEVETTKNCINFNDLELQLE